MKINMRLHVMALFVSLVFVLPVQAQSAVAGPTTLTDSLSILPESEMLVYVNASRILNDAMPRLVPEKELQSLRTGMDEIREIAKIDLRNLDFLVVAMRFTKPTGGALFPTPQVMFAMRGDFDAKSRIAMAMLISDGKLHEEKFGEHSLYTFKLNELVGKAANNSLLAGFSELAITTLDASTLAIGNTSYIKAALEAVDGRGRIKTEMLSSLLRNPNTLIGATGSPLVAFAKSFGLKMAESRDPNCITKFGEYYVSLTMADNVFKINGAMNADNPETAGIIKNMLSGLLQQGKTYVPDKNSQSLVDQVRLVAEGNEILVEATIPQELAAKFIRDIFAPPPPKPAASETKKETTTPAVEQKPVKP